MKPLSDSSRAERLTAIFEVGAALVDLRGGGNGFFEHEVGQLADPVMLLGRGNEFGSRDRAFFRVGPAGKRLGTDDPLSRKVELGLIGDPYFAPVDGVVELAEHRQLPRRILQRLGVVIFPFQPVVGCLFGRDQGAGQPVMERASTADFDAERDVEVDRQSGNARGIAEQRIERFEVVAERLARILEPGKNAAVALIEDAAGRSDFQPGDDLLDQLSLAVARQAGDNFLDS